jgi:NDP-sugar pyrophosphorylase family protein
MIPALVLTAGLATRLRPLSFVRAKAAMPVAGQPLVQRILRWLASAGVADAVLNLHHLPETITGLVGNGAGDGLRVRYSWEMPVLGSAGGPRHALSLLGSSAFLIVNGDTLTNVDVAALVAEHTRSGALVTMAVIPNTDPDKYSGLAVDAMGTFTGVVSRGSRQSSYHFVGVQVAEAEAFATLPDNRPFESVRQLYPTLVATRPGSVRTFVSTAEFFDIGTPANYLNTSLAFAARESRESQIPNPESRLQDCIVWDDVEVDDDARLRRCIVTDGVRVPARSSWENMTIRVAHGELMETERLVGELAIGPINGSTLR